MRFAAALALLLLAASSTTSSLMSSLTSSASDHAPSSDASYEPVFHRLNAWLRAVNAGWTDEVRAVVHETQLLPDAELNDILRELERTTSERLAPDLSACWVCKVLVGGARTLLRRWSFEQMLPTFVRICDVALRNNIPNAIRRAELCNGTVSTQGLHIAAILAMNISVQRLCEFQNTCLNSTTSYLPPPYASHLPPPHASYFPLPAARLGGEGQEIGQEAGQRAGSKIAYKGRREKRAAADTKQELAARGTRRVEGLSGGQTADHAAGQAGGHAAGHAAEREERGTRREELLRVVQLTDIHIDVRYSEGSETDCGLAICCMDHYGLGNAGPYGDYKCNIPPRTIELFLKKVADEIDPDLILYSGDISGSRLWDESLSEILNCSQTLTSTISRLLPNHTVYPCMGNHEMYPTNLYYMNLSEVVELTNKLADWWTPIARFQSEQEETFRRAVYYSMTDPRTGLRVITYNSQFMYTANWYNAVNHDLRDEARDMIAFVEQELSDARLRGDKVVLMGHHPPNSGDYLVEWGAWYERLALQYADVIALQLAGHRHNDNFHLVTDEEGRARGVMYLGPAVTAGGTKNPALRIYFLDPSTFEIVDYEQHFLDMKTLIGSGEPEIRRLYAARSEYNLTSLSAQAWSDFVDRLEEDKELFMLHYTHYFIDSRENLACDAVCQRNHVCNLRHLTWQEAVRCQKGGEGPASTTPPTSQSRTPPLSAASSGTPQDDVTNAQTTANSDVSAASRTKLSRQPFVAMATLLALTTSLCLSP